MNDLVVVLTGNPVMPIRGRNMLDVLITDDSGKPITDAQVAFDLDMTTMSHGANIVPAQSSGNGHYAGQVSFVMPGPWRVITVIQRPGKPAERVRFNFNVNLK
jgi:Cu(I)/Ag(I) efflux system membrane fusion protein